MKSRANLFFALLLILILGSASLAPGQALCLNLQGYIFASDGGDDTVSEDSA